MMLFPNVLLTAERRGRIGADTRLGLLTRAARLPVSTDTRAVPLAEMSRLADEWHYHLRCRLSGVGGAVGMYAGDAGQGLD